MNSELEAIMRRRRRKADGDNSSKGSGGSSKDRKGTISSGTSNRTPPASVEEGSPIPSPSSLNLRRTQEKIMAMRRQGSLRQLQQKQQQQQQSNSNSGSTEERRKSAAAELEQLRASSSSSLSLTNSSEERRKSRRRLEEHLANMMPPPPPPPRPPPARGSVKSEGPSDEGASPKARPEEYYSSSEDELENDDSEQGKDIDEAAAGISPRESTKDSPPPQEHFADFPEEEKMPPPEEEEEEGDDEGAYSYEPPPPTLQYEPPPAFNVGLAPSSSGDYSPCQPPPRTIPRTISFQKERLGVCGKGQSSSFACRPIVNPLSGNVIICRWTSTKNVELVEINLSTGGNRQHIQSTQILSLELTQSKFSSTFGLSSPTIYKVHSLTCGVHKTEGQARLRVGVLCEFVCRNVQTQHRQQQSGVLIWQWGYGTSHNRPVVLQSLLAPPTSTSFTYDKTSLVLCDGLVFLSGMAKQKGPCVFCVKPAVRNVWQVNMVYGSGRVTCLRATTYRHTKYKYLALALSDGSVSVWTYQGAVDRKVEQTKKTLAPLCRLECKEAIETSENTTKVNSHSEDDDKDDKKGHFATHLEWMTSTPAQSSMLLLAVATTNGMAIFHVSLPLIMMPDGSTQRLPASLPTTQLSQTVQIPPMVVSRWSQSCGFASVSWVYLGPQVPPSLAFLLKNGTTGQLVMGTCDFANYSVQDGGGASKKAAVGFRLFCESQVNMSPAFSSPTLLSSTSARAALWYDRDALLTFTPSLSSGDSFFMSLRHPITSVPAGLDSAGYASLPDGMSQGDATLFVYTVIESRRSVNPDQISPVEDSEILDWDAPMMRHWLCCSTVGDTAEAQNPSVDVQNSGNFDGNVTGGSQSKVICDLNVDPHLVPARIVRYRDSSLCAVLLRPALGSDDELEPDPVRFILVDTSSGKIMETKEGRDIVFLPKTKDGSERALVLSNDGASIQMLVRKSPEEAGDSVEWKIGTAVRPMLGVSANEDWIECSRLLVTSKDTHLALLLVGTRRRDDRCCLVSGRFVRMGGEQIEQNAIPNIDTDFISWLEPLEEPQSLVELPRYQDGKRCIAVATDRRVLLLSGSLRTFAAYSGKISSNSLASIGSHAVAFCSNDCKLRYLCALDGKFAQGIIATLPSPRFGHAPYHLLALRPDRFLYSSTFSGVRLVKEGESENVVFLSGAVTRPALLLEPVVASALCEADDPSASTILLRAVIERFGRKVAPFPHGDDEGIGTLGSGVTPKVLEMLSSYGLNNPASWLLSGTCDIERSSMSTILPPWVPMSLKSVAALNNDARLHVVSNGDQYFAEYAKSPDQNMASSLPRPTDPSSLLAHELARRAMQEGDVAGALALLDVAGGASSDTSLLEIALALQAGASSDVTKLLNGLSGQGDDGNIRSTSYSSSTSSSLAALVLDLKSRQINGKVPQEEGVCEKVSDDFSRRWLGHLAPSLQTEDGLSRARHRLIGEGALNEATRGMEQTRSVDARWKLPCNESKHVWNEGPLKSKENLLLLDRMDEWLGRRRPAVLGKEGAAVALEKGEKTLADILNKANDYDDDSFGGQSDEGSTGVKSGWVDGVGEGRTDEDNLSCYLRLSEGVDEDSTWQTDGLSDLTRFQNRALVMGPTEILSLEPTTSSVDEGEPGKVKLLCDLVFNETTEGDSACGLLMEVARGSSLDVGMLHTSSHESRQRSSIEFWYHLPSSISEEIVLARRSLNAPGEDLSKLCVASYRDRMLWELALLRSGELELRTSGGTTLISTSEIGSSELEPPSNMGDFGGDTEDTNSGPPGLVSWQRSDGGGGWNHVCLVFSSRGHEKLTDCTVKMFMKGIKVASTVASIIPPGMDEDEFSNDGVIDEAMKKSAMAFGLNAVANYRMTEIRIWACERAESDIKMMMYEYLSAAETKRKINIKIRRKRGEGQSDGSQKKLLAPPKEGKARAEKGMKGLLPPPRQKESTERSNPIPPSFADSSNFTFDASFSGFAPPMSEAVQVDAFGQALPTPSADQQDAFGQDLEQVRIAFPDDSSPPSFSASDAFGETDSLWFSAEPLSRQVRSSAAAALIRGPPATRHFGGNRGGLSNDSRSDVSVAKRFGVGAIAICGAEKTVVYDSDKHPPGRTYPIGASGAIISDEMDAKGSEYLCCFLAKDKRMVVFELKTKTVVVELQMTTKLNFWRYLPPHAHGHTLVFMLITPVGGFHWMPLDESPRPKQVWKRGPDLQGKKIVAYEEGGSNGLLGADARSTMALLLVSTNSSTLEAWIMQVGGASQAVCISRHVLGAALSRLFNVGYDAFLPFLVTASQLNDADIMLEVEPLLMEVPGELGKGDVVSRAVLDLTQVSSVDLVPPTLAMGGWPEVICCCHENIIVACVRRKGLMVAYEFGYGDLMLARQEHVGRYIVDAALRPGNTEGQVQVVLLLSDLDNPRDGRVVAIDVGGLAHPKPSSSFY